MISAKQKTLIIYQIFGFCISFIIYWVISLHFSVFTPKLFRKGV